MMELRLNVNGGERVLRDIDPSTPLLWVLRDELALVGTKYGCGGGFCGACTIIVDGSMPMRACMVRAVELEGRLITTIEGLAGEDGSLHPLQRAWIDHDVPQCGYCQAGQIMSAAALLARNSAPSLDEIRRAMSGNLCRCGCYGRIVDAIQTAAARMPPSEASPHSHHAAVGAVPDEGAMS